MKKIFIFIFLVSIALITSCSAKEGSFAPGGMHSGPMYDKVDGDIESMKPGDIFSDDIIDDYESVMKDNYKDQIQPGQLTAKALFDTTTENYQYFCSLVKKYQDTQGIFYSYQHKFDLALNRVKVVTKGASNVKVSLINNNQKTLWTSCTDSAGTCYLYTNELIEDCTITLTLGDKTITRKAAEEVFVEDFTECEKMNKIQILFMVDATGSMGDEMNYLKAELTNVIENITSATSAFISTGALVYRDQNDDYLVRQCDFSNNLNNTIQFLKYQYANGGGDFPEAVEEAYLAASKMAWESDATKIIVHVADAPSHDEDVASWFKQVELLSSMGVRILTVASSGIDKQTEYLFRMQSMQTNGCYSFLTNDSGIGGDHLEATVQEDLTVEYLNALLIRVITGMHTGIYLDPVPYVNKYPNLLKVNNNVSIDKTTQALLASAYVKWLGVGEDAKAYVMNYYGMYQGGTFVLMDCDKLLYTEALWDEIIEDVVIHYNNGNRIYYFKDGTFYTLTEAYEKEMIVLDNLYKIADKKIDY